MLSLFKTLRKRGGSLLERLKAKIICHSSLGEVVCEHGSKISLSTIVDVDGNGKFRLGEQSRIHRQGKFITLGGSIEIGRDTTIGDRATFLGGGNITIGNQVMFADSTTIVAFQHIYHDIKKPISLQLTSQNSVVIGDYSWIGINVTIVGDVTIGKHCVIAAGSVVTSSVPDYCVVAGVPAKIVRYYHSKSGEWLRYVE